MKKENTSLGDRKNLIKAFIGSSLIFLLVILAFGADAARPRPQIRFAGASKSVQSGEEALLQISAPGASRMNLRFVCPREVSVGSPSGELCGTSEFPPQTGSLTVRLSSSSRSPRLVTVLLDTRDASGRRLPSASARIHVLPRKQPVVKISLAASPVPQTVTRGANGFTFANLVFSATGSGEDIRVTSAQLNYQFENAADLNNCQLFDGTIALNTGSNVVNPVGASETYIFTLDYHLIVPKDASKMVALKCNIAVSERGSFAEWSLSGNESFNATGVTTAASALLSVAPSSSSHRMTFVDKGVLNVSLDVSSPTARLVPAGKTDVVATVLRFSAANEAIALSGIALQFDGNNPAALIKATIWDGATKVGEAVFAGASRTAFATLVSPVFIPRDGDKLIIVKADLASIGVNQLANAGDAIAINYDADGTLGKTQGIGQGSGTVIIASARTDTIAPAMRIFRGIPVLAALNVPTHTASNGTMILYRFSVTAEMDSVSIGKINFGAWRSSSSTLLSNFELFAYQDLGFSQQAYVVNPVSAVAASAAGEIWEEIAFYFSPAISGKIVIPQGETRYFELRALVSGVASGNSFQTLILGDSNKSPVGTFPEMDAPSVDDNFIWSGNSATASSLDASDWVNGYLMPGLPAGGGVGQVFSR